MPKPISGEYRPHASGKGGSARIRVGDTRETFEIALTDDAKARERTKALAQMAQALAQGGASTDDIINTLHMGAKARTEAAWRAVELAAADIIGGDTEVVRTTKAPTVEAFGEQWTSGELHRRHPDHVREKDSTRDREVLKLYIVPACARVTIDRFTLADAENVMGQIPANRSANTRKLVAQCMRKLLEYAIYPGQYLSNNPIPKQWMPKGGKQKAKTYLQPNEDKQLLACKAVDLDRRFAYGVLAREGLRASELEALRWSDVDLKTGRVKLDENKTDDPRAWALDPGVTRALTAWKKRTKAKADDHVVVLDLSDAAEWLREDLARAKVKRPELTQRTKTRQPIRLHDLRATFITIALANGKSETWVSDRTGHRSSQMIQRYNRPARTWGELGLGELTPLDRAIPELAQLTSPS